MLAVRSAQTTTIVEWVSFVIQMVAVLSVVVRALARVGALAMRRASAAHTEGKESTGQQERPRHPSPDLRARHQVVV